MRRLFLQFLVCADFKKSILDDAIVDIKLIVKVGLHTLFLDAFYKTKVNLLFNLDQQTTF